MSGLDVNNVLTLFDFNQETPAAAWRVQDDTVMGGRSQGHFSLTADGHGRFWGDVSLENNGGFSSIRTRLAEPVDVSTRTAFSLRLRGDGKTYTFRAKSGYEQRYYHQASFTTKGDGEWETITIPFASMQPVFRGRSLDLPNYAGQTVTDFQLLIGNKQPQRFEIFLDVIEAI
ncbi:MAG: CIA30 family protein [Bacteroidota bacterium]